MEIDILGAAFQAYREKFDSLPEVDREAMRRRREADSHAVALASMEARRGETAQLWYAGLNMGTPDQQILGTALPDGKWSNPDDCARFGGKLIIYGPAGTRKTTLLKRVVWELIGTGWKPRGGYIPRLMDRLKSKDIGDTMDWLLSGKLLILDDLDKLRGSAYEGERILSILDHYDSNKLPVLATMNCDVNTMTARLSQTIPADYVESIMSRLINRATFLEASGPDFRKLA